MGKALTPAERIERYAARMDERLRADEQSTTSMRVFTDSSLRQVLKGCGYQKRGSQNLRMIQHALVSRDVHPDPALTTPGLNWEQRIYFTRTPPTGDQHVERVRFPAERDLEDFLEANFALLFSGMRLEGRQYEVQSGKIDMLARDADGYVVIELKKGQPGDRLVNQLPRYMDDVSHADIARGGSGVVRGLVVASAQDLAMHGRLVAIAAPPPVLGSGSIVNGELGTEAGLDHPRTPDIGERRPTDSHA